VGSVDTGSLIILNHDKEEEEDDNHDNINDDHDDDNIDLRQFVENKIRLPLRSLGLGDCLEVSSFVRGKNCVRLIHQLGEIPSLEDRDRNEEEVGFE
jgi:hypothetical protein